MGITRSIIALAAGAVVLSGCVADGGDDIAATARALSMLNTQQVDDATLHANFGGYAYDRAGTYYDGEDGTGRVSWKQGGWTSSGGNDVETCTYGWCGPGGSLAGTTAGCVPGDDSESSWGYLYGACNSSAWGQRFAGYLSGVEVHASYQSGASGTTTFGYHPYWSVMYDGNCRTYQGWSYETHGCSGTPYVVTTPSVCGDQVCSATETCSSCASDCGACPSSIHETNLAGGVITRSLVVPSGADQVTISISGGSGDCDLHVKKNGAVSTSSYDCRPYKSGNTESCTFTGAGTYNILLNPYSSYSGVTLDASYTTASAPACGDGVCNGTETCSSCANDCGTCSAGLHLSNLSVARDAWTETWTLTATNPTFVMSGGTGDADLYVRLGSAPTTSSYDCRPWKSGNNETCTMTGSGTWYVRVYGYSAASGFAIDGE